MILRRSPVTGLVLVLAAGFLVPAARARDERTVTLAGGLGEEELVVLSAHLAAAGGNGVLLLDSPGSTPSTRAFLDSFKAERIVPVGVFPDGGAPAKRLDRPTEPPLEWKGGWPTALWEAQFPRAERVVVCGAGSRRLLLQAACLAGVAGAPLVVTRGGAAESERLGPWLKRWETREVIIAGSLLKMTLPEGVTRTRLNDEAAVAAEHRRRLRAQGPIDALVVANPADIQGDRGGMSSLAPWVTLRRRAALLLTGEAGTDTAEVVRAAVERPELRRADALLLVASLKAIPVETRPNPIEGKDSHIEMEPLTPAGDNPSTFGIGRLFHQDRNLVALMLARERLLAEAKPPFRALVASNPGDSLPLLEMFSRHTARELQSRGYDTTALFQDKVEKDFLRKVMPEQDIFLWEGHHKTMVEEFELPKWTEPMRPTLVVLQSCLALNEAEVDPLFRRGAVAVIGSSTRTYSGSGGAFTLAFFDALLYDQRTLGGSLRQAKNFLLAYTLLKQKRLGEEAKMTGANRRSSWAFSLWGDPTLMLPRPQPRADAPAPIKHEVRRNTIVLTLPEKRYEKVVSEVFQTRLWPNGRLAGLLTRDEETDDKHLIPLVYAEVPLPRAPDGQAPRLSSRLSSRNYVFLWDGRRKVGYLLVRPSWTTSNEIRFTVSYAPAAAPATPAVPGKASALPPAESGSPAGGDGDGEPLLIGGVAQDRP